MSQFPRPLNRRYGTVAAVLLITIWLWVALDRPYQVRIFSNTGATQSLDPFDFDPIASEAIKNVCDGTEWNNGLVFTCDESVGGVASVRNSILNCVRYSISAGAALVLPNIVLRDSIDLSKIRTEEKANMSYMFDTKHFLSSLNLSCPTMRTFYDVNEIDDYQSAHRPVPLLPESLVDDIPSTGLPEPENWRRRFDKWLDTYGTREFDESIIVHLGRSYMQYPVYSDGEGFAHDFGKILKFRTDVRTLATKAIKAMGKAWNLKLDLTLPILPDAFFGCHVQFVKDVVDNPSTDDWTYTSYAAQAQFYLDQAPLSDPRVIYAASGDPDDIAKLKVDAETINMNVTTKYDLLVGKDLEVLNNLTWDQQAMVDFLILLKASDFGGVSQSAFAWNVTLKRHLESETMDYLDGGRALDDEYSTLFGKPRSRPEFPACLWP